MGTAIGGFRHVLCPVDFSDHSRGALRYASALARRWRAGLTVLFVNDPLLGSAAAAAAYDARVLAARTEAELRRLVARTLGKEGARVTVATAIGHPAPEIIKAAGRLGADLIVMGSRGLTGPGKWFFGSTTERTLRSTGVPTLVVPRFRPRSRVLAEEALRSWPGRRVVVPVDLADYKLRELRTAVGVARTFGARPILLHVVPAGLAPSWMPVDPLIDERRIAAARAQLEKLAVAVGADAECRVATGDPVREIAASAAHSGAGLIVLTLRRAAGPWAERPGAVTYGILCREVAPVLAIPAGRPQG